MTEQSLAGRRFGAYEILEELGAGGMGKVYRARNVTLERIVALKTLAPQFSADEGFVQRFLKEARAAARLNHSNIVQIYDFGCEGGVYYLAMEYVDGQSLSALLKRRPFSERDGLLVIRHAVRALAVAHAEGIVHRDIKPDNLMLTAKGGLKLVDLGIAKRMDEGQGLTQTGQAVGTPLYISPEQIRGAKDIDARADIYSLGATFYQLVTGHAPYTGTSSAVVMTMHLTHPVPDPRIYKPSLSEGLCRVLAKMMAKDRDKRYPDVYALDKDLYRLQSGEAPEASDPAITGIVTVIDSKPAETPVSVSSRPPSPAGQGLTPAPTPTPTRDPASAWADTPARAGTPAPSATPPPESKPSTPPPPTPAPFPTHPSAFTPPPAFREEDLHFVEVELARHIGPLARVLVKKAARTAANLVALGAALADDIPGEPERRAFRAAIRARAK